MVWSDFTERPHGGLEAPKTIQKQPVARLFGARSEYSYCCCTVTLPLLAGVTLL